MSKLARTLVLGVTLAAMNLAGLTAVASAQTTDEPTSNRDARRPPPRVRSGRPGASKAHTGSPLSPAAPGGRPPRAKWKRPGATQPAPRRDRPNRAGRPAGSSYHSASWLLCWSCCQGWPCWPPGELAAELAAGLSLSIQPEHGHSTPHSMGLPRPPGSPIALPVTGRPHGAHLKIADKDEVPGSSPGRPTNQPSTRAEPTRQLIHDRLRWLHACPGALTALHGVHRPPVARQGRPPGQATGVVVVGRLQLQRWTARTVMPSLGGIGRIWVFAAGRFWIRVPRSSERRGEPPPGRQRCGAACGRVDYWVRRP